MSSFTVEERAERRTRIGASEVAALAGLSRWATPMSVWLDKMGLTPDVDDDAEHLRWGHLLEDVILDEWQERTGFTVRDRQTLHRHPDHPHHGSTPDGLVYEGPGGTDPVGVVDAKTTGSFGWDALPEEYLVQSQWQIHTTGVDRGFVVVLHAGRRLEAYETVRDDRLIARLVDIVDRFWTGHVVTGEMPPVDGTPATDRALRELHPRPVPDSTVELPPDLVDRYRMAKALAQEAEADLRLVKQEVQALLGDAEIGLVDGRKVFSWKGSETTTLDSKAIRARYPRAATRFTRTTTTRRFLDHLEKTR